MLFHLVFDDIDCSMFMSLGGFSLMSYVVLEMEKSMQEDKSMLRISQTMSVLGTAL